MLKDLVRTGTPTTLEVVGVCPLVPQNHRCSREVTTTLLP